MLWFKDFVPWFKVALPHGNGRYAKRSLIDIDPDSSAPPFNLSGYVLSQRANETMAAATAILEKTSQESSSQVDMFDALHLFVLLTFSR